jgi:hypothetical protein
LGVTENFSQGDHGIIVGLHFERSLTLWVDSRGDSVGIAAQGFGGKNLSVGPLSQRREDVAGEGQLVGRWRREMGSRHFTEMKISIF